MGSKKIKSLSDIEQLREGLLRQRSGYKTRVLICMTGCRALGAQDVGIAFREKLKALSLESEVKVVEVGCIGMCAGAPVVVIEPQGCLYRGVAPEDVDEIISTTIQQGRLVERLAPVQGSKAVAGVA